MGMPVAAMSKTDKIAEAMRRSLPLLPADARQVVMQMLSPVSLGIIAATLTVWAGSQFFGVGEIVDAILLMVGFATLGFSVFQGARELLDFARGALDAKSEKDLDAAGAHFASAVTLLGVSAIQALLLRGPAQKVLQRGVPRVQPRIAVAEPPPDVETLRISRPAVIADGVLGITDEYGAIEISRDQSLTEQRITLYHELVHRFFSPRTGPLLKLRAEVNISGYVRSALLKYLEEALAEGYAQFKVNGLAAGLRAYRFPIDGENAYVTVSQLGYEGQAIGTITLGGAMFYVSVVRKMWNQR